MNGLDVQSRTPRVSVAVLTYNVAAYVTAAVRGVLDQTFSDIEIIVVDDASTDDTVKILEQFSDPRLHVYRNEKNLGFAGNVNRAMELVRGELVSFPGSDDIWEPGFLQRAVDFLDANARLSLVHTGAVWIDAAGRPFGRSNPGWHTMTPGTKAFMDVLRIGFCFPAVVMRSALVRSVGPMPQWWGGLADSWLVLQMCLCGDVGYIDRDLVRYRVHDKSISLVMYHSGEYFRHHRDIIASSFDWPKAQTAGLAPRRREGLRYVASDSIKLLHVNRAAMGRWSFLRQYLTIVVSSPTVLIYPHVWLRLGLGLLPRSVIASLRDWKRRRWQSSTDAGASKPAVPV
jgi:glycosyltransferase involved in cell wall biosynthesis